MMDFLLSLTIFLAGVMTASWTITSRFLHYFQQEEYDNVRFLTWWIRNRSLEKRATLASLVFAMALWLSESTADISNLPLARVLILSGIVSISLALLGRSNRAVSMKKALVMTSRARRIFIMSLFFQGFLLAGIPLIMRLTPLAPYHLLITTVSAFFIFLIIPLTLVASNFCLWPIESVVQRRYLNEARTILARVKPEIIGITGSYGKTSFKHILGHILASHAPTLATPGSVNTLMGITRIVRERLRNDHAFFLVEMGAYGIGSIQRLCGLTPPKLSVVTAIGLAHMERFKSIEAVYEAKSELPKALPENGMAILNGDDPNLRRMGEQLKCPVFFYGTHPEYGRLDCRLLESKNTENGLFCIVAYEGKSYSFEMPIYGSHQALNATGAFLTAMRLGVAPFTAIAALQSMPSIPHRLVVERHANGTTTIDDAYNSNPTGFRCALEVLGNLNGTRKILITPGMVELGQKADETHREIASVAAKVCHDIVLVAAHRLQAFREGLIQNGFPPDRIHEFAALKNAQEWLNLSIREGDVVLYENDLPDLYEKPEAFRLFE